MNRVSIGSDNGLSPIRRQAITWTNAGLLSIEPLGTNFSEIWIEILAFSFRKMRLKMLLPKWRPSCPGGDEWIISCEIALRWMSQDLTDDWSTSVQVMALWLSAPSHYPKQCSGGSLTPYGITRPQWVNIKTIMRTRQPYWMMIFNHGNIFEIKDNQKNIKKIMFNFIIGSQHCACRWPSHVRCFGELQTQW